MTRFPRPFVLILGFLTVLSICLAAEAAGQAGARRAAGGRGGMFGGMMPGGGLTLLAVASDEQVQDKLGLKGQAEAIRKLAEEGRGRRGFPDYRNMTQEQREAAFKKMREDFEKARKEREAMTEEQREAARKEARAAREKAQKEQDAKLKGLVGEAKYNQLDEIRAGLGLRQTGPTAVLDPRIAALLKLTDKQKEAIQKVVEKLNADRMKLFEGLRGRRGGGAGPGGGTGGPSLNPQVVFVAAAGGGGRRAASPEMEKIRAKMDELRKAANKAISEILTKAQKDKITALMKAVEGIEFRRGGFRRTGGGERPAGREGGRRGTRRGAGDQPEA